MIERAETLKPQDVFIACQLAIWPTDERWTYALLSDRLCISGSEICDAIKRCRQAKLVTSTNQGSSVVASRLFEFLVKGVPTAFFPRKIEVVRGVATGIHSPLFKDRFAAGRDIVMVWPYNKGRDMGEGLLPLYPTVPVAALRNQELYYFMAAVDVLRVGRSKERTAAEVYIAERLGLDRTVETVEESETTKE